MKVKLTPRDEWFLEALVEQYVYGETRNEVLRKALHLLVGAAQDAGRLPRPIQPAHGPSKEASND